MNEIIDNAVFARLASAAEPTWWTGTPAIDPTLFVIDGGEYREGDNPLEPSTALADRMRKTFYDYLELIVGEKSAEHGSTLRLFKGNLG